MGKSQRDKGNRCEYLVRDQLRKAGFQSDRVPCSGAAQGFKGDLRGFYNETQYLFEVKARKKSFTSVYEYFRKNSQNGVAGINLSPWKGPPEILLSIADDPVKCLNTASVYLHSEALGTRFPQKLRNMQQWVKGCDVLVIKDDRQPPLYLRYT